MKKRIFIILVCICMLFFASCKTGCGKTSGTIKCEVVMINVGDEQEDFMAEETPTPIYEYALGSDKIYSTYRNKQYYEDTYKPITVYRNQNDTEGNEYKYVKLVGYVSSYKEIEIDLHKRLVMISTKLGKLSEKYTDYEGNHKEALKCADKVYFTSNEIYLDTDEPFSEQTVYIFYPENAMISYMLKK